MAIKRWKMPKNRDAAHSLATETGLPILVCAILAARGWDTPEAVMAFCGDKDIGLDSPFTLIDMDKAVARILEAIQNGERIAVYGDYDCDGVTATALLISYLGSVGADVIYYVPDREKEGYGLNKNAVDILKMQRASLIITVDNGVSAHEEIAYAASLGISTVVTDHHTPRDTLPSAVAVVNPHRRDCPSRFKNLAGVGVAFKLVCALEGAEPAELLEYYSELVALGTIADCVSVTGENRVICRHGLSRLQETENPGLQALVEMGGLTGKSISSESAAFGIIPRINACGRMGAVDDIIGLLLTDDSSAAGEIAAAINEQNNARRSIEDGILTEIDAMLASNPEKLMGRLLMLEGEGWHHGIVGIIASKLMERYCKPVIIFATQNGEARGSGRSIPGFSLISAISSCSGKLSRYGGHTLAAGMTLSAADLHSFMSEMEEYAKKRYPIMPVPEIRIDCALAPQELTIENISSISCLEPFGEGNEQPVFLLPGMRIEGIYPTSDGKHLRLRFQFGNNLFYAIYFRTTEPELPYVKGNIVNVAASVTVSEWNGIPQLSVRICDIRPSGIDQEALLIAAARYQSHLLGEYHNTRKSVLAPSREDIAVVYRRIRGDGPCYYGADGLYYKILASGVDFCRVRVALDILTELGLVETHGRAIRVKTGAEKTDLGQSMILKCLAKEE